MTSYLSQISQLESQLANLQKQDAQEAKKEADLLTKQMRATEAATRASSTSTVLSKMKEAERAAHDLASVRKKRSDLASSMATKSKSLLDYRQRQVREDEKDLKKAQETQKRMADEQKRLIRERQEHEKSITRMLNDQRSITAPDKALAPQIQYDFFISHASEDKDAVVRDLASALTQRGASVFYDEMTLKVGDSLRRSIDRGLANSRFGVVVLSEHFFRKEWPQRELDGLTAMEVQGKSRILPIWHKVSKDEVTRHSPVLADKLALDTLTKTAAEIADELMTLLD